MSPRFFIFGAGYSGRTFAKLVRGEAFVAGTTRSQEKFERLRVAGIAPHEFDGETISDAVRAGLAETTHLIVSTAPGETGDPVLAVGRDRLASKMPQLRWIGYLSTVGVYGDHGGAWVDEKSACRPVSRRSVLRVAAEQDWLAFGQGARAPVAVAWDVRCAISFCTPTRPRSTRCPVDREITRTSAIHPAICTKYWNIALNDSRTNFSITAKLKRSWRSCPRCAGTCRRSRTPIAHNASSARRR